MSEHKRTQTNEKKNTRKEWLEQKRHRQEGKSEGERSRGVLGERVVELYLLVFHVCTMSLGLRGDKTRGGRREETRRKQLRRPAREGDGRGCR